VTDKKTNKKTDGQKKRLKRQTDRHIPAMIDPKIIVIVMKYFSLNKCHRSYLINTPHHQK